MFFSNSLWVMFLGNIQELINYRLNTILLTIDLIFIIPSIITYIYRIPLTLLVVDDFNGFYKRRVTCLLDILVSYFRFDIKSLIVVVPSSDKL